MRELNVPSELLEPPLLDGNEQVLIEDYLKLIIKKLEEWTANLMNTEIEAFTKREEPPEVDSDGLYGMQGAVILFQMVNQQVDLAMDSGQGLILARVVEEVNRVMRGIQERWTKLIEAEFKKQAEKLEKLLVAWRSTVLLLLTTKSSPPICGSPLGTYRTFGIREVPCNDPRTPQRHHR